MDDAPRVAEQIERFARVPHHAQHQLPVHEVRLDRADARMAVLPESSDQAELPLAEAFLAQDGEVSALPREVTPAHTGELIRRVLP